MEKVQFKDVVNFHGHVCPGLAMGYRVAELAVQLLDLDPDKEDLLAVVENNSCAVDAIQVVTGCTFGKGNLMLENYGKQVYTIVRRPQGEGVRVAVKWTPPSESEAAAAVWKKFMIGDRSADVVQAINSHKAHKAKLILEADPEELFKTSLITITLPERAKVYPTVICHQCKEKLMEPKAVLSNDGLISCIPCSEKFKKPEH